MVPEPGSNAHAGPCALLVSPVSCGVPFPFGVLDP